MLRILNTANGRASDYSRAVLAREAKHAVRGERDSDGKVRAWYIEVRDGAATRVRLAVDYLTVDGAAKTIHVAI